MAKKQTRQKTTLKTTIQLGLVGIFAAALFFGVAILVKQIKADNNDSRGQADARDVNTASDILETEEDLKDENKVAESSNDAKDRMEADERTKPTVDKDESGLNIAKPEVSFVAEEGDKIAVGGSITNINETGGACTYVFSKGSTSFTVNAGILPNPSYISCETIRVDKNKFASGTWTISIKYKSNTSEGESEAQTYTIQ